MCGTAKEVHATDAEYEVAKKFQNKHKNLKMLIFFDPVISLLGFYSKRIIRNLHEYLCAKDFSELQHFVIVNDWN